MIYLNERKRCHPNPAVHLTSLRVRVSVRSDCRWWEWMYSTLSTFNTTTRHKWLPTAPGVCSWCVCSLLCVCTWTGKCRARIPSMGHHTWLYVTSLSSGLWATCFSFFGGSNQVVTVSSLLLFCINMFVQKMNSECFFGGGGGVWTKRQV